MLVDGVMTLIDQYERLTIATRTRRGRLQKAAQGGYSGGGPAYGYRTLRGSKVLTVSEDGAKIIRRIFALHRRGLSPYRIADALNEAGLKTRERAEWRARQVYRILGRRALYDGRRYEYGGVEGPSQVPPILV